MITIYAKQVTWNGNTFSVSSGVLTLTLSDICEKVEPLFAADQQQPVDTIVTNRVYRATVSGMAYAAVATGACPAGSPLVAEVSDQAGNISEITLPPMELYENTFDQPRAGQPRAILKFVQKCPTPPEE